MGITCDTCGRKLTLASALEVSVCGFRNGVLFRETSTRCDVCCPTVGTPTDVFTHTHTQQNEEGESPSAPAEELTPEEKLKAEHVHHKNALSDKEAAAYYDTVIPPTPGPAERVARVIAAAEAEGRQCSKKAMLLAALDSQGRSIRDLIALTGLRDYAQATKILKKAAEDGEAKSERVTVSGSSILLYSAIEKAEEPAPAEVSE